jgi:transcriptional regulator NrdR family protein
MECVQCGYPTHVLETNHNRDNITQRRRECLKCKLRFSTTDQPLSLREVKQLQERKDEIQ